MLPLAAQIQAAQAPQPADRMLLATNAVCREQPSSSSREVATLGLGERFRTGDIRSEDGQSWILVIDRRNVVLSPRVRGGCWVPGPLTTEFSAADPEPAMIAIADHILGREEASFRDLVTVENLFAGSFAAIVESSGVLQARRLQLIDQAGSKSFPAAVRDPLARAWLLAHREVLQPTQYSVEYRVPPDVYWTRTNRLNALRERRN